jgi:cytochrome oxidase assembly protein ShyY1
VRFLLSRRWLLFAAAVALLAYGCWWLGEWQFHRLEERQRSNAVVERNLAADPVPVQEVLAPGRPVSEQDEWRHVSAVGSYDDANRIVVRYQTRDGVSGVDVVTPLRLAGSGDLLLVDRGWVATDNQGDTSPEVPSAPGGEVRITGWVRADATGDSTVVHDRSTRAISSRAIGATLDGEVLGGFVDLESETPEAAEPLALTETPDLGSGPHFFYGLQWWFFAALAVFGFGYLAYDERRKLRSGRAPGSQARAKQTTGATPG